ncbi:MAG: hypothetical protein Q4F79_07510 [Eubacteriales bacterium]|nr:hypothetical protein [Eubacteriales bacterium]
MGRPSKPAVLLQQEGKSHRTKSELASRKHAEESMLSGKRIKADEAIKSDPIAYDQFRKVKKLMAAIEKDDELYGATLRRYCILASECERLQRRMNELDSRLEAAEDSKDAASLSRALTDLDRQLQNKRKMMFDIEKENCMTVQSALRSIPKKTETKKSALLEALEPDD